MAIRLFEGFDYFGFLTENHANLLESVWEISDGNYDHEIGYESRNGGNYLTLFPEYHLNFKTYPLVASATRILAGFAFMNSVNPGRIGDIFRIKDGAGEDLVNLQLDYGSSSDFNDVIVSSKWGGSVEEVHTFIDLFKSKWYYYEFDIKLDSPEHFRIYLNGSLIKEDNTVLDFAPSITNPYIHLKPGTIEGNNSWDCCYDDMYLLDDDPADGAKFTQRLGPISIKPLTLSANGASNDFTPLTASDADKRIEINEVGGHDGDATYIYTETSPAAQTFQVTGAEVTQPIHAIINQSAIRQEGTLDSLAVASFVADDGTVQEDADPLVLGGQWKFIRKNYTDVPSGGGLTPANVEATEWGIKVDPAP